MHASSSNQGGQRTLSPPISRAALEVLLSDSGENEVRHIRLDYQGSKPRNAQVEIQGVPAQGVVDSGADITIMGGDLFRRVAAVAKLKKRDLKRADKVLRAYDQPSFTLDGRVDLDISFGGITMQMPVYVKMDSPTPLLLSEGMCHQLKIIAYHPEIHPAIEETPRPQADMKTGDHQGGSKPHKLVRVGHDRKHEESGVGRESKGEGTPGH